MRLFPALVGLACLTGLIRLIRLIVLVALIEIGEFAGLSGLESVLAQAAAHAGTRYQDAIRHAAEEYSLGHWSEARVFFERAHALYPNARTARGLGLTCYESRKYLAAVGYFKQALHSPEQPLTAPMRAEIEQLLQQAQAFVTRVVVTLEPASAPLPRQLQLELDGVVQRWQAGGAILVDPGEHELVARAHAVRPKRQTIYAEGGELRVELRLSPDFLNANVLAAPAVQSAVRMPRDVNADGGDRMPYIVLGAGGAALLAGAVLVGIAVSDKYAVEHASHGTRWPQIEPRYIRGRTFFPVGFALMGVGLAGVAAGLTWKLWPVHQERAPNAQLRLSPGAVELLGRF